MCGENTHQCKTFTFFFTYQRNTLKFVFSHDTMWKSLMCVNTSDSKRLDCRLALLIFPSVCIDAHGLLPPWQPLSLSSAAEEEQWWLGTLRECLLYLHTTWQQEVTLYTMCDSFVVIMEPWPLLVQWHAQSSETLASGTHIHTHNHTHQAASLMLNESTGRAGGRKRRWVERGVKKPRWEL